MKKSDKIQLFKEAREVLREMLENPDKVRMGICFAISASPSFFRMKAPSPYNCLEIPYPEFLSYKPEEGDTKLYWFPTDIDGMLKRIGIMNEIIKQLEGS